MITLTLSLKEEEQKRELITKLRITNYAQSLSCNSYNRYNGFNDC